MNTPMASLTGTLADMPPYGGPRRLDDDVFQTAEEAVLVEGQGSPATLASSGVRTTGGPDSRRHGESFAQRVRSYVAERPCQSALLAAAAGALAMAILRSRLRGRFASSRSLRSR